MTALADGLIALAALYFGAIADVAFRAWRDIQRLAELPRPGLPRWPRLSVITPARDEGAVLDAALRSRLMSDYPDLELVVVDDRSRDQTGAIIDRLASEDSRLKPLHLTELPAGWLGKVNALARGVEASTGEWLLFTDADIHFTPDALSRAVGYAERRQVEFLTVFPELWTSGAWVDAAITAFMRLLLLGVRRRAIENPASRAAVGGGVFNLVKRSALARTEGFAALRMEVIDDVGLAQMVKRAGGRCSVASGHGLVKLHFYRSLGEMMRGLEKNAYAALGRFRLWQLLPLVGLLLVLESAPFWAIALGGALRPVGAGLLALDLGGAVALALWMRRPLRSALLTPLGAALVLGMVLRSAALTTARGGIAWRETFYSLEELRKGRKFTLL